MNVLVVGGAGYVGSHAVKRLAEAGHTAVIFDNLSTGHAEVAERLRVPLVQADLGDGAAVERALHEHRIDVVMHFAAFALVGESVADPLAYYDNNVAKTIGLLKAMAAAGARRLIFSSTCAVYGNPDRIPVTESEKKAPVSPYGRSKLMVEQVLADHARANREFSCASLRYFNASGAAADGSIGEDHDPETHLVPILLQAALGQRPKVVVYGEDYDTPDGTAVRDYVHVDDLADAHILAMGRLAPGVQIECNLGTGAGFSVRQMIDVAERVTGKRIPVEVGPRRDGDAAALYADASLAKRFLGWEAKHQDPAAIVSSAWEWHRQNPSGYATSARRK
jgi:UDP-glucose-4-epimerase GalE